MPCGLPTMCHVLHSLLYLYQEAVSRQHFFSLLFFFSFITIPERKTYWKEKILFLINCIGRSPFLWSSPYNFKSLPGKVLYRAFLSIVTTIYAHISDKTNPPIYILTHLYILFILVLIHTYTDTSAWSHLLYKYCS